MHKKPMAIRAEKSNDKWFWWAMAGLSIGALFVALQPDPLTQSQMIEHYLANSNRG